ncbi:MAG: SBBP repeat-containing protein [candidate division WOR-3 bacterium]
MAIIALITSLPLEGITPKPDKRAGEIYEEGISMLFTQNVGQIPNHEVVFYTIHPSVVYVLRNGKININGITIDFGKEPRFITGDMEQITRVSYFGNNKSISGIATYKRVVLKEVYPNVDVILTADGKGVIEFQYIVKPGGNVKDIRVKVEGELKVKEDGIYVVEGEKELVKLSEIKAYQGADEVEVRAKVEGKYLSFEVGRYDKKETLVIDPFISITFLSDGDVAHSLAIDGSGNVFVAGYSSNSSSFAPSRNFFGTTGYYYVFVSKLSNDLSTHIATAILASSGDDYAYSVAIDGSGNVFVAGYTMNPSDFAPSRNIFGTTNWADVFVSKLSNDLSAHIATAILASSGDDYAYSLAIDNSGNVFVAGWTLNSSDFAPSRNVFGTTGLWDVFVSKFSNDLSTHIATAILTSSGDDYARSLAIDISGNVFVVGYTYNSSDFAPSRNVFGTTGSWDVFVSKLSNDLRKHIATAILTSSDGDYAYSLAIDGSGNVFVAGATGNSSDFAPSRNVFGTIRKEMVLGCLAAFAPIINVFSTIGSPDAFVIRLSNELK